MVDSAPFHAGKPTLTTHPVIGGDALSFPITPAPPSFWWIAMRRYAHTKAELSRPWDQQSDGRLVVECPRPSGLSAVIDAVDAAVAQANDDYARELELREDAVDERRAEGAKHDRDLAEIQQSLDELYADDRSTATPG